VKPLPAPDIHKLRAAQGWLELGNPLEAKVEWQRIEPAYRSHPDVVEVQCHIYASEKHWEASLKLAELLMELVPERPGAWIAGSIALYRLQRTGDARDLLARVVDRFPENWVVSYNLACYCAQLGRFDESREWLQKAMALDEAGVKKVASEDPDLKPLWDKMGGIIWENFVDIPERADE
jgi:tetratricopeptide (TPR) repeat protein